MPARAFIDSDLPPRAHYQTRQRLNAREGIYWFWYSYLRFLPFWLSLSKCPRGHLLILIAYAEGRNNWTQRVGLNAREGIYWFWSFIFCVTETSICKSKCPRGHLLILILHNLRGLAVVLRLNAREGIYWFWWSVFARFPPTEARRLNAREGIYWFWLRLWRQAETGGRWWV